MPIRFNLLAEQQAEEDLRRRDPVKRAIWVGSFAVALVLIWSGSLQLEVMNASNVLSGLEGRWRGMSNEFNGVTAAKQDAATLQNSLEALQTLAASRFLWGTTLYSLEQALTNDNIQITRLESTQVYKTVEGGKPRTSAPGKVSPAAPASATEQITLSINGRDWGRPTEQSYMQFKEALASYPFFRTNLLTNGVGLMSFSAPQPDPNEVNRTFVTFILQCRFPDQVR